MFKDMLCPCRSQQCPFRWKYKKNSFNIICYLLNGEEGISMFWSLSFHLLPDEKVLDDSTQKSLPGLKPAYSVFLTNRRAIFRFDGLGSALTQSFFYDEIVGVKPSKRLFFNYLLVRTVKKDFLLNTAKADYWAKKILEIKESAATGENSGQNEVVRQARPVPPGRKKRDLLDMLTILRKNSLLSDAELEEKIRLLDTLKI